MKHRRLGRSLSPWFLVGIIILAGVKIQAQSSASSSSELVGQLSNELSITRPQARGGAGTLFSLAKSRLTSDEFSKIAAAVPGMSGLLRAAPATSQNSEFSNLEGSLPGNMGRTAQAAEAFHKLGLSPTMATKFVPIMSRFVQSKGGQSTASLLEKALK
jgi:Protein of unknown function VcgC/VcgE (DUF2780)